MGHAIVAKGAERRKSALNRRIFAYVLDVIGSREKKGPINAHRARSPMLGYDIS